MQLDLSNRVALVTGGDSGIGAACARALGEAGADVAILYHSDEDGAQQTARAIRAGGRNAEIIQGDVGREEDVQRAFDATEAALGMPTILVNSAGLNMSETPVAEMELDQWERVLRTDLTGVFLTSRLFVRRLEGQDTPAAIINISSIHETAMRAGGADYGVAKGGVRNLTQTLALEVAERKITVNNIAPGMILTPMNQEAMDDENVRREAESHIPAKRAGQPEEIGRVAVFLAAAESGYITGTTVTVDGALSLVVAQGA